MSQLLAQPAGRPAVRVRRRPIRDGAGWLLGAPAVMLALLLLLPIGFIVAAAARAPDPVAVLTTGLYPEAVVRTVVMAAVVTVLCVVLGVVYSLAVVLAGRGLRTVLLLALFVTFWVSLLVRTYGWILLLQPAGALDELLRTLGLIDEPLSVLQTTPAMYPAMVHVMLPYMVLPVLSALAALDRRQILAAQSMGAPPWTTLRRVVLPQLRGGILAGAILVFILSLGFFVTPAFLGGPEDLTVATIINVEFNQFFDVDTASLMAVTLLVAVLALYVVADRLFSISRQWGAQ